MAAGHSVALFLRGMSECLVIDVREEESRRLRIALAAMDANEQTLGFFRLRTLDSRVLVVNLSKIQLARLLWDRVTSPPDMTVDEGEQIRAYFDGRGWVDLGYTEEPIALYYAIERLETMVDSQSFVGYDDEDGEDVFISPVDLVCLSVPAWLFQEGKDKARGESGAD